MTRPQASISALKQRIARLNPATAATAEARDLFSLGANQVDQRLGGGLVRSAVHELFADGAGVSSAVAFALILALRGGLAKPILWISEERVLRHFGVFYGPGLVELGADPDRFIFVHAPDALATLRAGADSVKCGGLGAVVIQPYGKARALDLTASRRLALAASASGVLTLLLRIGAEPAPSAAQTRWQVKSAPSVLLEANAPGRPAFDLTLLRHRAGIASFTTRLEWDREQQICVEQRGRDQTLSGSVSAPAFLREDQAKAA
jgi:protein ImuA